MSREFDSLRKTSLLPDWITLEEDLGRNWLLVKAGTHGDERGEIEYVRSRMGEGDLPPGILPILANKEAADQGIRYTGTQQLMSWYPGRFPWQATQELTNEDQTAAGITWLIDQLASPSLVIDRHNTHRNDRYGFVGERTTAATLAAAHIMGHRVIELSRSSPLPNSTPDYIAVEEATYTDIESQKRHHEQVDRQLATIASLGYTGLTAYYYDESIGEQLTYYELVREICIVEPRTRTPNLPVLSILPELEAIEASADWGAEINLSQKARKTLGLHPTEQYYRCAPAYENWSPHIENTRIGISDDKKRRVCLGTILARRAMPRSLPGTDVLFFAP